MYNKYCREQSYEIAIYNPLRGISSAGRAPALHAGGQEFESPILHHKRDFQMKVSFIMQIAAFRLCTCSNMVDTKK